MKTLTGEQKEQMWDEIRKALMYSSEPGEGEYTLNTLIELTGFNRNKLRLALDKLLKDGVLGVRRGVCDGNSCNVYFPLKETSVEEVLKVLVDRS